MKYLLIAIAAGLLFIPFLGSVPLQDPLALYNAATAPVTGPGNGSFAPFPLWGWLQSGSVYFLGNTPFALRLPNALIGIITLLTFYAIGKKHADDRLGTWWALIYAGCWLPFLFFRSALPDPLFNYLFFLCIYFIYRIAYTVKPLPLAILSGICLGLAVLVKGPLAIILALLLLLGYWIASKGKTGVKPAHLALWLLFALIPAAVWLTYTGIVYGWLVVQQYIRFVAGLLANPWPQSNLVYYMVLLPGCFPAVLLLLCYFYAKRRSIYNTGEPLDLKEFKVWMWLFFWVVLLLCPSSLYMVPLSFLAAWQVYRISAGRQRLRAWHVVLLLLTGIAIGLGLAAVVLAGVYKATLLPYAQLPAARAFLQSPIVWSWWEALYGLFYILLVSCSVVLLFRRKYQEGLLCLFIGSLIFIAVTALHFVPKLIF